MPNRGIAYATLVRADPGRGYGAFATAEGLDGWFTTGAIVEVRAEGGFRFGGEIGAERLTLESGGRMIEADRPKRVLFRWNSVPEEPESLTTVELTFEPDLRDIIVRVRDGVFPHTDAGWRMFCDCYGDWGEAPTLMKFYVEHGVGY